jgi:uncharacterized protein YjbI with pentapeptide repeats
MVAQAQAETSATIVKIMLTFAGVASFCLLSLLAPDSSLLTSGVTLNVPFAGPVSFLGFMIIGPLVLIVLRIYLQIYLEPKRRLDPIGQRLHPIRVPTLDVSRNALLRAFTGFVVYLLLPLTMLAFTWKAAVMVARLPGLVGATTAVIGCHVMLALGWPWRSNIPRQSKILLGIGALIIPAGAILTILVLIGGESLRRPFNLSHADLSEQWLTAQDLRRANLFAANLLNAHLVRANLSGANLAVAHLSKADLSGANLSGANVIVANLSGALLFEADLSGAHLSSANLSKADLLRANLSKANLSSADLSGALLTQANLSSALLLAAHLSGASLVVANLSGADLRGADLGGADLRGADLRGADLRGADLSGTYLLSGVDLRGACGDAHTKLPSGVFISQCP